MESIGKHLKIVDAASTSTSGSIVPSPSQTDSSALALSHDPEARQELSQLLAVCFEALKTYGKEPEQINSVNRLFQMTLADYSIKQIKAAFAFYLKTRSDMPAPADIVAIIERGNRPPLDRAVYISLSQRHEQDPWPGWSSQRKYMDEYERFQMTGKHS